MIFPHLILIDQFQISGYLNCFMKFNHPSSLNTRRSIIKYVSTLIKGNILHMFIYLMQSNSIKRISFFFNYCFFVIWHHYKENICPCFDLMIDVFRRIGSISAILRWKLILKSEQFWFLPASPKAKAGLGVQSLRPSVPKSCHRNSSETTDPFIMKLGM